MVIDDAESEEGEEDSPKSGIGDGLDDVVQLGRDVDARIFGVDEHRGETTRGRVGGVHFGGRIRGLLDSVSR